MSDSIQVRVARMALDAATKSPVVLLQAVDAQGVMPIWIGPAEANAIAFHLSGQTFERPLTHDLLRIVIEGFGAKVRKVVITELRGSTFYAKIFVSRDNEILTIDARPSDSIALALRAAAPIFVARDLFERSSRDVVQDQSESEEEGDDDDDDDDAGDDPLQKFLDDLDPPPEPPPDPQP